MESIIILGFLNFLYLLGLRYYVFLHLCIPLLDIILIFFFNLIKKYLTIPLLNVENVVICKVVTPTAARIVDINDIIVIEYKRREKRKLQKLN